MKTFTKERWEVYKASFISTPKRYPVEMALALLIFLIHCTKIVKDINCCEFWIYCAIVVAYIFNSRSEYKWCKIVYYLMPLAAISIWFIDIRAIVLNSEFIIFFILCLVLLFITPKCRDNNDFSYGSLRLFFYSGVSIAIGGLILLAAYAIFFSVEMIFQIDTYSWRSEIAYLVYPFLMLWCFFIDRPPAQ